MPPAPKRVAFLLLVVALLSAGGGVVRAEAADSYAQALRLRARLDATPRARQSTAQYGQALNAFRAVYHADRTAPNADDSVEAVAELLAEQGRTFNDPSLLRAAIAQLEFLRRDFGASRFSIPALLSSGEIEARDLHDDAAARQTFTLFLTSYPRSPLAPQATAELRRLGGQVPAARANTAPGMAAGAGSSAQSAATAAHGAPGRAATRQASPADDYGVIDVPPPSASTPSAATRPKQGLRERDLVPPAPAAAVPAPTMTPPGTGTRLSVAVGPSAAEASTAQAGTAQASDTKAGETQAGAARTVGGIPVFRGTARTRLSLVTGVRHWSTGSYTRIAVDLQDEVPFEASRVSGPDRIFFDFHGARLAPELAGKAVTVSDGGFLERIRAAQFSGDVVRVVLDVTDVSDYSAFWLPNPSRLIIDIHGRPQGAPAPMLAVAASAASAEALSPQLSAPPADTSPASGTASGAGRHSVKQKAFAGPSATPSATPAPTPMMTVSPDAAAPPAAGQLAPQVPSQPHTPASRAAANGTPTPTAARAGAPGTFVAETAPPGAAASAQPRAGDSLAAIAALSQQPSRVRATRAPTTAPVSAISAPSATVGALDGAGLPPAALASRRKSKRPADAPAPETPGVVARAAEPDAMGGRSMVRALGLKINRIVVDAGHGGHDSGTLGPGGIEEKDVVLDVALRLGKLLKQRLGADVTYTRDDDTFIPLETRTAIANKAQADLFISVHANSSPDASARGVETYYLNFTSSADALEVAARENAVSDESIHQLSDLVKKITLQDKIAESREFASDVEGSLYQGLQTGNAGFKDRGVKKAPFVVLIGANMPSILAEISFLTNPDDAAQLHEGEYRQRIAESLYKGVARYVRSLSGAHLEAGAEASAATR